MPGILELLVLPEREVTSGEVLSRKANGFYQVKIADRILSIKTAVPQTLNVGARVVVADTAEGKYIVAAGSLQNRQQQEVIIDG
jgi:hypothetical protein